MAQPCSWSRTKEAITDVGGAPDTLYYQVQGINNEVNNQGQILNVLHSNDLRYVRGWKKTYTRNSVPSGLSNWSYEAGGNNLITNVDVEKVSYGEERDGLIGLFTYDGPDPQWSGQQFFMLTNVWRSRSLSFTVTFDSSVTVLYRKDRGGRSVHR